MKILAIKLRHIGDNLLAGAALRLLSREYPSAEIDYMVPANGGGAELMRAIPGVRKVVEFPSGYAERRKLAEGIRREDYEMSIDFSWDTRSACWGLLSGADIRLGYYFRKRMPAWPFYTRACEMGKAHTALANLDLAVLAGATPRGSDDLKLRLNLPSPAVERMEEMLADAGVDSNENILVLHPMSRWAFKSWTDEGSAKFLDTAASIGLRPVLTSGPSDAERSKISRILEICKTKPVYFSGQFNLLVFAALLGRARLFVGVDSAPVHIASAVGTPVVALFGPSGQKEWYPWQVPHRTIQRLSWSCCPCAQDGCAGTKRSRCLEDISAEEVLAACKELMRSIQRR